MYSKARSAVTDLQDSCLRYWDLRALSLGLYFSRFVIAVQSKGTNQSGYHCTEQDYRDQVIQCVKIHKSNTPQYSVLSRATWMPRNDGIYSRCINTLGIRELSVLLAKNIGGIRAALLCVGVLTVTNFLTPPAFGKNKIKKSLAVSGWAAEWDQGKDFAEVIKNQSMIETVWLRTLTYKVNGPAVEFAYNIDDGLSVLKNGLGGTASTKVGVFIHNATDLGFDTELGRRMIASRDTAAKLTALAKQHGISAVNIDIESLAPSDEQAFTDFVAYMFRELSKQNIRVSVALHARSETHVPEHARFQNWQKIAAIGVDAVLMAYDYSWSTSEPGFVAPMQWVLDVSTYGGKVFGKENIILALPAYGYRWTKQGKTWLGQSEVTRVLESDLSLKAFKPIKAGNSADGILLQNEDMFVGYETTSSLVEKVRKLSSLGFARFAIWRLGGESKSLLSKLREIK